jgi:hypothetical protein
MGGKANHSGVNLKLRTPLSDYESNGRQSEQIGPVPDDRERGNGHIAGIAAFRLLKIFKKPLCH